MNISSPEFRVWQHLKDHWNKTQLQKLADIPVVPVAHLYQHMINNNGHIIPFTLRDESIDDTASIWRLFSHTGIYITTIGLLIPTWLGIFCCYFCQCQLARLVCQPLWSGSMQHTIVDDDVEAASIYSCDGKAERTIIRLHKNQYLHMPWEHTWTVSDRSKKHHQKHFLKVDH